MGVASGLVRLRIMHCHGFLFLHLWGISVRLGIAQRRPAYIQAPACNACVILGTVESVLPAFRCLSEQCAASAEPCCNMTGYRTLWRSDFAGVQQQGGLHTPQPVFKHSRAPDAVSSVRAKVTTRVICATKSLQLHRAVQRVCALQLRSSQLRVRAQQDGASPVTWRRGGVSGRPPALVASSTPAKGASTSAGLVLRRM